MLITLDRSGAASDHFDATGNVAIAADAVSLLEHLQVVIHHTGRRNPQFLLDVPDRGRVVVVIEERPDEVQDGLLALGKALHPMVLWLVSLPGCRAADRVSLIAAIIVSNTCSCQHATVARIRQQRRHSTFRDRHCTRIPGIEHHRVHHRRARQTRVRRNPPPPRHPLQLQPGRRPCPRNRSQPRPQNRALPAGRDGRSSCFCVPSFRSSRSAAPGTSGRAARRPRRVGGSRRTSCSR